MQLRLFPLITVLLALGDTGAANPQARYQAQAQVTKTITTTRIRTTTRTTTRTRTSTLTLVKDCYPRTFTETVTVTATPCVSPTLVATLTGQIQPPPNPTAGPDYAEGLVFGPGWAHIACESYCSSHCGAGLPSCDPSCSNKGTCGLSTHMNLYLGNPPILSNPQYTITPAPPARSFSIPVIYLTAGETDFVAAYPNIIVEIRSWDRFGNPQPNQAVVIPKPPPSTYYSEIRVDMLALGLGDVSRLEFLPYQAGSIGVGGQGPDGRVLAAVKVDGDGLGGPIPYQVFTPQC